MKASDHPLPGIPLIESPFFDQIFGEGAYPADVLHAARQIRRDGFAVIDFPDPDLPARIDRIKRDLHDQFDWEAWRSGRKDSLRLQDAWATHEDVKAIALNANVLELLTTLYGRRVIPFQTLNFPVGTQQAVHSDAAHFQSFPGRFMCGVWVALEDIGPDQGPLLYYPGTHRWPFYDNEQVDVNAAFTSKPREQYQRITAVWDALIAAEGLKPVRFLARKGQALIWTANLLHGGDRQNDLALMRWSQVTHCFFENCAYYDPMMSNPFYGKISFRSVRDLTTRQVMPQVVGGHPVPEEFIRSVAVATAGRGPMGAGTVALPSDFDPAAYLRFNPDVAGAGVDPKKHYLEFGCNEGRRWK